MTEGEYKRKFHVTDINSPKKPAEVHAFLKDKMTRCYQQKDYPVYEKTLSNFDQKKNSGVITYEIDNQSQGPIRMVLVDVLPTEKGSVVKVYSKGDLFRPAGVYEHQIQKWMDGKMVNCNAHGML